MAFDLEGEAKGQGYAGHDSDGKYNNQYSNNAIWQDGQKAQSEEEKAKSRELAEEITKDFEIPVNDPFFVVKEESIKFAKNLTRIIELIFNGLTIPEIAVEIGMTRYQVIKYRNSKFFKEYIDNAYKMSAELDVEKAEEILLCGLGSENMAEANIRRELSGFYRWRAAIRDRERFQKETKTEVKIEVKQKISDQSEMDKLIQAAKERKQLSAASAVQSVIKREIEDAIIVSENENNSDLNNEIDIEENG